MDNVDHFVEINVEVPRFYQQGVRALVQDLEFFAAGKWRRRFRYISSRPVAFCNDPGPFEFQIRPRDCVGVYQQLLRKNANRWNLLPGSEPPRADEMFHLVDNLDVDRHAVSGGNVNLHLLLMVDSYCVLVY